MAATVTVLGVFWAPVMALVSDVAEANGVDQAHAAALMNLGWAAGQIVGSAGAGAAGKAFGDGVPTLAGAGLVPADAARAARRSGRRSPSRDRLIQARLPPNLNKNRAVGKNTPVSNDFSPTPPVRPSVGG